MFIRKTTACIVSGCLLWNSAYANFAYSNSNPTKVEINAEEILSQSSKLRGDMTRALNDEQVLLELGKMGIKKSEVEMRLAAMSDRELQQVRDGVQRQAGGDVIVISVTTFLIIIIIILLIKR